VAPHRPAFSLVAENGKAGRVLSWTWGFGASSFEKKPALLDADQPVEEVATDVSADEVVEVGWRGYYAA
jgi:hypothetical protein